ncbi:MAG: FIST N-terminal domain-containing protein [Promethearchaeota archaeon]
MGMFARIRKWFRSREVKEAPEAAEGAAVGANVRAGFAYRRAMEGMSAFDLAKDAATEALNRVGTEDFSMALVYSAYEHNPKDVAAGISAALSGPWIGSTTSGEITSAGLFEDSIVVSVINSPHIKFGVGFGTNVCKDDEGAGKTAINMALESLTAKGGALKEGSNYIVMHGSTGGEEGVIRGIQQEVGNIPVVYSVIYTNT